MSCPSPNSCFMKVKAWLYASLTAGGLKLTGRICKTTGLPRGAACRHFCSTHSCCSVPSTVKSNPTSPTAATRGFSTNLRNWPSSFSSPSPSLTFTDYSSSPALPFVPLQTRWSRPRCWQHRTQGPPPPYLTGPG
ncbi:hypothetical protein ElyMa_006047500 [Elysia marginata]|uniref:Uncharacterized protein n=1 Tax=Elysia marginata TaxID=1093978 RepID=A0AAV4GL27_9GAST|nr:hypothetical protein ElyMa_006047500 [Elysia marginata]